MGQTLSNFYNYFMGRRQTKMLMNNIKYRPHRINYYETENVILLEFCNYNKDEIIEAVKNQEFDNDRYKENILEALDKDYFSYKSMKKTYRLYFVDNSYGRCILVIQNNKKPIHKKFCYDVYLNN